MYNILSIGRARVFVMPCFLSPMQSFVCFVVNFGHVVKNILEQEYFVVDSFFY